MGPAQRRASLTERTQSAMAKRKIVRKHAATKRLSAVIRVSKRAGRDTAR